MTTTMRKFALPALRVALLGVCAAALAAPMFAQDAPPPPPPGAQQGPGYGGPGGGQGRGAEMQAHMLKRMTKELNLTDDQVSQIQAIQSDEATKIQALQADTSDSGHGKHQQMKAIHDDQMSRTRAVLTDDQKPKFDAMLQQMKERQQEHHQRGGTQPPPPPPAS